MFMVRSLLSLVVDPDYRPFVVGAIVGFTVAAIGIIGEVLGWWRLLGEVLTFVGLSTGVLSVFLPFVVGPSKRELRGVAHDVRGVAGDVRDVGRGVQELKEETRRGHETTHDILRDIRDRLGQG